MREPNSFEDYLATYTFSSHLKFTKITKNIVIVFNAFAKHPVFIYSPKTSSRRTVFVGAVGAGWSVRRGR